MNVNYQDMKQAVYVGTTALGFFLLVTSLFLIRSAAGATDPAGFLLPAAILFFAGLLSVFFGMVTFIIRDDPDVWR